MPVNSRQTHSDGFSLFEVLIFVAIISTVLIAAASYMVRLLVTLNINQHKSLASYYAEDVKNWLDGERQTSWLDLVSKSSTTGTTYCVNNALPLLATLSTLTAGSCSNYNGVGVREPRIYKRELTLTTTPTESQVSAHIVVSWQEGGKTFSIPLDTIYFPWN